MTTPPRRRRHPRAASWACLRTGLLSSRSCPALRDGFRQRRDTGDNILRTPPLSDVRTDPLKKDSEFDGGTTLLWGDPDHVRELLGDRVTDVVAERRILDVDRFSSGAEFRDFFKATYGPTIAVYQRLAAAGDTAAIADLDRSLAELGDEYMRPDAPVMEWEYLLLTARRV